MPSITCLAFMKSRSIIGSNLAVFTADSGSYVGIKPTVRFADGSLYIQRPYPIELTDGQIVLLPPGTKIMPDNSILYEDGSKIEPERIKNIPTYTAEELDVLYPWVSTDMIKSTDD